MANQPYTLQGPCSQWLLYKAATCSSQPPLAPKGTNTLHCTSEEGHTARGGSLTSDQFRPVPPLDRYLQLFVVTRTTHTCYIQARYKWLQQTVLLLFIPTSPNSTHTLSTHQSGHQLSETTESYPNSLNTNIHPKVTILSHSFTTASSALIHPTTHQYGNVDPNIVGQGAISVHEEVVGCEEDLQVLGVVPHQLN